MNKNRGNNQTNSEGVKWLVLSPSDVKQAREVLSQLGPDSTVDALGLGVPLERISDHLFPGTSTLHTRVRYQIFVPAIICALEEKGRVERPEYELKRLETKLIESLLNAGEELGVIGRTKKEKLQYWPSRTYWSAINTMGMFGRNKNLSKNNLFHYLGKKDGEILINDEKHSESEFNSNKPNYPTKLRQTIPSIFSNVKTLKLKDKLNFNLEKGEAQLLQEIVKDCYEGSLLAYLLTRPQKEYEDLKNIFKIKIKENSQLKLLVNQAGNYSRLAMGITYAHRWALCKHIQANLKRGDAEEWAEYARLHQEFFKTWRKRNHDLQGWKLDEFDAVLSPIGCQFKDQKLKRFIAEITPMLFNGNINVVLKEMAPKLEAREKEKKKKRSHFYDLTISIPDNFKPTAKTRPGDYLFDFRWRVGKSNAIDIVKGLRRRVA